MQSDLESVPYALEKNVCLLLLGKFSEKQQLESGCLMVFISIIDCHGNMSDK